MAESEHQSTLDKCDLNTPCPEEDPVGSLGKYEVIVRTDNITW